MEKTLVILKPDAVRRKLTGAIIGRFERKGCIISNLKMMTIQTETAKEHYHHVNALPFFKDMISYITSGPVVIMILEGEQIIKMVRNLVGKTSCIESSPGTIRGDFGFHSFENLIHASDSSESAEIEMRRFFPELF
ncbi:MAG: nucleoside-diphosphate kinase [Clostridia bacterium]|nr:nucleoside-diphosphate kinase [Clostridia bacterium]